MVDTLNSEFDINSAWGDFCDGGEASLHQSSYSNSIVNDEAPKSSEIYISTKTKISYLNQAVNLSEIFWKLPVLEYHCRETGIVKKQMKFNSTNEAELNNILKKIPKNAYTDQYIITRIINPTGRIQFKDVRKISVGLSKKDIISYRGKQKGAFYNCFVILLRILVEDTFKEVHIKVFNTGKLEIPGMRDDKVLYIALKLLVDILNKNIENSKEFNYIKDKCDTVLINSNFRCGFYLNREILYDILKNKYRINCSYDSCSYPGIQCEFYYDSSLSEQTGQQPKNKDKIITKVSFMIFRTGSALIVGKCSEEILNIIYKFLCKMLQEEYRKISCGMNNKNMTTEKNTQRKVNKKKIVVTI
jgi:hypothetical protein